MDDKANALALAFPRLKAWHTSRGDIIRLGRFGIVTVKQLPAPVTTFSAPVVSITSELAEQYDILIDGVVVDTISA